jgi:hypothetical protein
MNTLQELQQELKALSEKVEKALSEQPSITITDNSTSIKLSPTIQPFEGTKRVRIVKANSRHYWYNDRIGQEFDVVWNKKFKCLEEKDDDDGGYIDIQDCTEVEPQPQQAWEKYPTYKDCKSKYQIIVNLENGTTFTSLMAEFGFPTEALAKYARAVMILSTVAKKWNEGVGVASNGYFPKKIASELTTDTFNITSHYARLLPFYFHSEEACQKSIELFPNEWKDFFNAKG